NAGATGTFSDKNVGAGKSVTASGFAIGGADSSNYSLTQPAGLAADITAKALSIPGVTASNKVRSQERREGMDTAGESVAGIVARDTLTVDNSGAAGTFSDKNVGTGKSVTASGFAIGGADSGNYSLSQPAGLSADITAKALSILGVTASNKV